MSSFWKPTCLDSTHFSMDFLISKRCTLVLFEVQAIILRVGWKMIEVIRALPEPRRSSYSRCPSSAEKILMMVPFVEALAIKVPSALTAKAPTSLS